MSKVPPFPPEILLKKAKIKFLEETKNYIPVFQQLLQAIKDSQEVLPNQINSCLKILHTIKGGAGFLQEVQLLELTVELKKDLERAKNNFKNKELLKKLVDAIENWLRYLETMS